MTQLRRFATGLDTLNGATNEGQRADCAPRGTTGDGAINSADVVQGRRYAAGLDPLTGADGPPVLPAGESLSSIFDDIYAYFFGREIRVGAGETKGETILVPIELISQGGEAATSFTLEYDASLLSDPVVTLGKEFESASLTINSNEKGRIGILVDLGEPINYSSAPVKIVYVRFHVSREAAGDTLLTLTSSLATQGTSDAFGNVLSTRYVGGKVSIIR